MTNNDSHIIAGWMAAAEDRWQDSQEAEDDGIVCPGFDWPPIVRSAAGAWLVRSLGSSAPLFVVLCWRVLVGLPLKRSSQSRTLLLSRFGDYHYRCRSIYSRPFRKRSFAPGPLLAQRLHFLALVPPGLRPIHCRILVGSFSFPFSQMLRFVLFLLLS